MTRDLPYWRSLLYIPAINDRYVQGAHRHGADAIILDLEDSIAANRKLEARSCLSGAIATLKGQRLDVIVRVNSGAAMAEDISAAVAAGAFGIDLPKVTNRDYLAYACETVTRAEIAAGRPAGEVKMKLLLESAEAFLKIMEIADFIRDTPRIVAMTIGNEDLATQLSLRDKSGPMLQYYQQMVLAAAYCGIMPLGMPGDVTDYRNLEELRIQAEIARNIGLKGSSCIHPSHVEILNGAFGPSAREISDAETLVRVAGEKFAQGAGVFAHDGRMIDAPVVERARQLLSIAGGRSSLGMEQG